MAKLPPQPSLHTERLVLRPHRMEDAPAVQRLAGERRIFETTLRIPHPYKLHMAEEWLATHPEHYAQGKSAQFAICLRDGEQLIGAIGLEFHPEYPRAELGYWVGVEFWSKGYCTEAARAVLGYGFAQRGLHRIYATHFGTNPASGRVMQKVGMTHEGTLRRHLVKEGRVEDLAYYGILANEWQGGSD